MLAAIKCAEHRNFVWAWWTWVPDEQNLKKSSSEWLKSDKAMMTIFYMVIRLIPYIRVLPGRPTAEAELSW